MPPIAPAMANLFERLKLLSLDLLLFHHWSIGTPVMASIEAKDTVMI